MVIMSTTATVPTVGGISSDVSYSHGFSTPLTEDAELKANPPAVHLTDKIQREILADKPRVTRLEIPWDDETMEQRMLQEKELAEAQVAISPSSPHENVESLYILVCVCVCVF